ncbi:GPCR fungal pheromone mating factor [Amylostereum chailletii]|nr:GPCR fungal pheromone mating factor [Amylostereum chailletii]
MDPTYPLFPILNLIAFFLALIPVCGVLRRSLPLTLGAFTFAVCLSLASLIQSVNLIAWKNTYENIAPIWCDISVHLEIGAGTGISVSALIMTRRLYKMISTQAVNSGAEIKKEVVLEVLLAVGFPCFMMGLYYIIQPFRFGIIGEVGCVPTLDESWVSMLIYHLWPLVITMISTFVYCPLIGVYLCRNPQIMREILNNRRNSAKSGSSFDQTHWIRMLFLCFSVILASLLTGITKLVDDFATLQGMKLPFWVGWSAVHGSDWGTPFTEPDTTDASTVFRLRCGQTIYFVLALALFLLFGVTATAKEEYRRAVWAIGSAIGVSRRGIRTTSSLPEMHFEVNPDAVKTVTSMDSTRHE